MMTIIEFFSLLLLLFGPAIVGSATSNHHEISTRSLQRGEKPRTRASSRFRSAKRADDHNKRRTTPDKLDASAINRKTRNSSKSSSRRKRSTIKRDKLPAPPTETHKWLVGTHHYTFLRTIYENDTFNVLVYLATYEPLKRQCAVKRQQFGTRNEEKEGIVAQLLADSWPRNEFVVEIFAQFTEFNNNKLYLYIVMEHLPPFPHVAEFYIYPLVSTELKEGSSLEVLLEKGNLRPEVAKHFIRHIIQGLAYLIQKGITHKDFFTSNIVITALRGKSLIEANSDAYKHARAVIIDFGIVDLEGERDNGFKLQHALAVTVYEIFLGETTYDFELEDTCKIFRRGPKDLSYATKFAEETVDELDHIAFVCEIFAIPGEDLTADLISGLLKNTWLNRTIVDRRNSGSETDRSKTRNRGSQRQRKTLKLDQESRK